jgi:hypothetical protein
MDCGRKACIIPFQPPGIKKERGKDSEFRIYGEQGRVIQLSEGGQNRDGEMRHGCRGGMNLVFCGMDIPKDGGSL